MTKIYIIKKVVMTMEVTIMMMTMMMATTTTNLFTNTCVKQMKAMA